MKKLSKDDAIKSIKSFLKYSLKLKGHDIKSFNEKFLTEKAEEIFESSANKGDYIHELEPKDSK